MGSRRTSRRSRRSSRRHGNATKGEVTPVIFRIWPAKEGGDVIALFPTIPGSTADVYSCESYQQLGQHGKADCEGVIRATRAATPREYASLKRELESAPYHYKLKVYARQPRIMRERRIAEARRQNSR